MILHLLIPFLSHSLTAQYVTDYVQETKAPLQCYTVEQNVTSIEICRQREQCCFGLVKRVLADNETAVIENGGCWHDTGNCATTCHHTLVYQFTLSMCECNSSLCNQYITYKEPPPTQPPPLVTDPSAVLPVSPKIGHIIGVALGFLLLCCCLGAAAFIFWKKYIKKEPICLFRGRSNTEDDDEMNLLQHFPNGAVMPQQFTRQDDITVLHDIGHGRFGQVQKAKLGDEFIAIKKFHPYDSLSFLNELLIMSQKSDPNILCLLGYIYTPTSSQLWLLTEYMPLGNMSDYLRAYILTIPQCLHLLSSFIGGLCYLHSEPQAVAHRDIKTRNVLLVNHKTCKIADFGLALVLDYGPGGALNEKAAPPTQVGTPRYMAPEVLEGSMFYREAEAHMRIDVYAASLVMWEMMSRTQLDQRDSVPPYLLPFERQIPGHPTPCEMQALVAVEKQRPELRAAWHSHPVFNKLEVTLTESWDNDENARLSSKTIQARIIPLLSNESDSEVSV